MPLQFGKHICLLCLFLALLGGMIFSGGAMAQSSKTMSAIATSQLDPRWVVARIPNGIDSLQTNAQVGRWINQHAVQRKRSYFYPAFQLDTLLINYTAKCQQDCARLNMKPWLKADIDGNGRTDLIAFRLRNSFGRFTRECYIFYDYGPNGNIQIFPLSDWAARGCELATVTQAAGRPAVLYTRDVTSGGLLLDLTRPIVSRLDTLVHQHGALIEYNAHPVTPPFERLELNFGADCCAAFSITIQANRKLEYQVKYEHGDDYYFFNKERGNFRGELDSLDFQQLMGLFKNLDIKSLEPYYEVGWTDAGTVWLTAEYGNGHTLSIKDYGWRANWTLMRLYDLVYELRASQRWYSTEHPYDVPVR